MMRAVARSLWLATVAMVAACGAPPATSFDKIDPAVTRFSVDGPNLNFKVDYKDLMFESAAIMDMGKTTKAIADGLQRGIPGPTAQSKWVQLQISFPGKTRTGEAVPLDFGNLRFEVETLRKAKLDRLSEFEILNLADAVEPGQAAGFDIARTYCADGMSRELVGRFCALVNAKD